MCVLSIKEPIRKKSENLFNDPRISIDLSFVFVKNGSREFLCLTGQITKINELIFWPTQILGVVWCLKCPASYGRAERIDSSEPKVVRGVLINKFEGEAWMDSWLKEVG